MEFDQTVPSVNKTISEQSLQDALRNDEFVLYHQPKVSLLRGEITGSEALVRWIDGNGRIILPDDFIPFAERTGVLRQITLRMLELSIEAIDRISHVSPSLSVSMNVTPVDLELHHVSHRINEYLDKRQITADQLQIEITESVAMGNLAGVQQDLVHLNEMGIKVVMDDFGTGYSSIDRLSQLPFSSLKLDKGVVRRMATSRQNLDVVRSSISMARELRMTSVAEGVESEGAYNFLLANGCEEAQGYWIAHPMPLDDYMAFLGQTHNFDGSQIGRVHQAMHNLIHFRKSLIDAAYCADKSLDTVLSSVIDPEVQLEARQSRFGIWYFGIGQNLSELEGFAEIESAFLSLHNQGQEFMQRLQAGADKRSLNPIIEAFDLHMDQLTSHLLRLERELLLYSGDSGNPGL